MADKWVDLSDDQIEALLTEAETRLSSKGKDDKKSAQPSEESTEVAVQASTSKPGPSTVTSAATALNAPRSAASSDSKPKESLSVRVPEARKTKKEDVSIHPQYSLPIHTSSTHGGPRNDENKSQFN